jgi:hypothetical protein
VKWLGLVVVGAALATVLAFAGRGQVRAVSGGQAPAQVLSVEAFVWRFNADYPGAGADADIPLDAVYVKTHDGTNWMTKWDTNANAIGGPESLTTAEIRSTTYSNDRLVRAERATFKDNRLRKGRLTASTLYADVEPKDSVTRTASLRRTF